GYPGMVSRSKAGFSRRWGLFDEEPAWRSRPASDLRGRDASRCGHLRSNTAEAVQEQTRTEGEKGAASSQSEGGGEKGRPQPQWTGSLGLANGQRHGLWRDTQIASGFVSGGLARGAGTAADPGGTGPRPAGQVPGQVFVHHRFECRPGLDHRGVLPKMVDRGRFQIEQAGDEDSRAATLVS